MGAQALRSIVGDAVASATEHTPVLQSRFPARAPHAAPPFAASVVTVRVRVWKPVPQVTEHVSQEPHPEVVQLTGALVGAALGAALGTAVGNAVGAVVGDAVGNAVGAAVGSAEHVASPMALAW